MANCTGIGGLGKEEDIGNIITGEDWNTKDTRELLLNLEKEATADMVAESMEEVDTKVMKDVRV
ncbi:MAG: hypothetical protein ACXU93_12155 [Thermodesulfobacteriota bacterium]|jgi:hypothetical protein